MPYMIQKKGSKFCLHKQNEDKTPGEEITCHDTEEEAKAHMRALYANVTKAVKFADGTDNIIEGPGMPFGGPFNGQDIVGEHFSAKTNFAFDWFKERPLLYHHGLNDQAGIAVVGRVKKWETQPDIGVWTKAELDKGNEYFEAIKELVDQGKLFFSSGSMRHLVKVNKKSGEIEQWPWIELSLTPTPANPFATVEMAVAEKYFETAGIKAAWDENIDEIRAVWTAASVNDLPDSAFGYIEDGGEKDDEGKTKPRNLRHFPYKDKEGNMDEAHIRNALARIPQSNLPQEAKNKALTVVKKAAKKVGIEVAENKSMSPEKMKKTMKNMADSMDIEVSEEEMSAMMDKLDPDMDTPDMMKEMATMLRKHKAKAEKAVAWEDVREEVYALLNPHNGLVTNERYVWIDKTYDDHVLVSCREDGKDKHYTIPFPRDAEGHVEKLGEPQEIEFVPKVVKKSLDTDDVVKAVLEGVDLSNVPLVLHIEMINNLLSMLSERTEDLIERRTKEGRTFSSKNQAAIVATCDEIETGCKKMRKLVGGMEAGAKAVELRCRELELIRLKRSKDA